MVSSVPISWIYPDLEADIYSCLVTNTDFSSPTITQCIRQLAALDVHSQSVHYMLLSFISTLQSMTTK